MAEFSGGEAVLYRMTWPTEYDILNDYTPEVRARALLLHHLSPKQQKEFLKSRGFTVRGSVSRRKYVISYGRNSNVSRGPKNFCAVTTDYKQPISDQMLAQKVLLENDEDAFLRVAIPSFGSAEGWTNSQMWCAAFGMVALLVAALHFWGIIP